jgi:lipopolysaccharide cholinephosphotransferase
MDYDDGLKGVMPRSTLGTPQAFEFEGRLFMGVEYYDDYLSAKYGNYMQLPPPEKQIQHHFFRLDLNRPYKETTLEDIV